MINFRDYVTRSLKGAIRRLVRDGKRHMPSARRAARRNERLRATGLQFLDTFSRDAASNTSGFARVLVDGQWDNANYWVRYALLRKALGLSTANEVGLLGQYNRDRAAAAFSFFGFFRTVDHGRHVGGRSSFLSKARELLETTRVSADVHGWSLPGGLPAAIVYDGILKRQRRAEIDLSDPRLPSFVAEALSAIAAAEDVLDAECPDLVVLSHVVDFSYGSLAWCALTRGIPVIALYGDYGTNRFIRLQKPQDLFVYPSRPTLDDGVVLGGARTSLLTEAGAKNLVERMGGRTGDVSAIYAYGRRSGRVDKAVFAERFGWDPQKPVIGVYAPNWFDYPNGSGRFPFRDFLHWVEATLSAASNNTDVNWLFKAHPCDEWYGTIKGPLLADLVVAINSPYVRLCETSWNGRSLFDAIDGLVTVHGTAGLEAAHLGKPVLVPYSGWYGSFGFAHVASSADDYVAKLSERWWEKDDLKDASSKAAAFAGWYFCAPDWHEGWFLADDSNQDAIWWDLNTVMQQHAKPIAREVAEIQEWFGDGHRYFQIFKMLRASGYVPAYPRAPLNADALSDPRQRQLSLAPPRDVSPA